MPPLDPVKMVWLPRTFHAAKEVLQTNIFSLFFTYSLIVATASSIEYYFLQQKLKYAESELSRILLQRSWQVLKLQLQPHFLFNTLQSISELAIADPLSAQSTISRLSELLRVSLDDEMPDLVPFTRELDFVTAYLDIEKIRFGERLLISIDMGPQALDAAVPSLLLQPIVENAIRHGIAKRAAGGRISISAQVHHGRFSLSVRDTATYGQGRSRAQRADGFGIGLRNTEERLRHLYKEDFALKLTVHEAEACVDLEIPYTQMTKSDIVPTEVLRYDKI
jgi:LytS/YehU family sensor histidine kinase